MSEETEPTRKRSTPTKPTKQITIVIPREMYDKLKNQAESELRPFTKHVEWILKKHLNS